MAKLSRKTTQPLHYFLSISLTLSTLYEVSWFWTMRLMFFTITMVFLILFRHFMFRLSVQSASCEKLSLIMILSYVMGHAIVLFTKNVWILHCWLKTVSANKIVIEFFSECYTKYEVLAKGFAIKLNAINKFFSSSRRSRMALQVLWLQDGNNRSNECSSWDSLLYWQPLAGGLQ